MAEGLCQDSMPHAKAGQSSKSNYLRSSVALDMSLGDCSNNLLLESSPISAWHSRQLGGLDPSAPPQPHFVNGYHQKYGNVTNYNGPMAVTQTILRL